MNASSVPAEGAPGSTVAAPSQPQAETIPTNPGTIIQTGSINTLDQILTSNWIYDSTFTVSTSQSPGTIVYSKKIHPRDWNWATNHVAQMFNCYTGAGSVRYRPVATVWYGGSIRVGYLPPSVTAEQLNNVPLEILTTFPNRDIDPKNTGWVEFSPPDERNVAYHYLDDNDRQGFGGWIVFYVAARLVTQSPEYTTIQMLVETKGGFMFDQVNPAALSIVAQDVEPLEAIASVPLSLQTLADAPSNVTAIQIEKSSTNTLPFPGLNHSAFGDPFAAVRSGKPIHTITRLDVLPRFPVSTCSFDPSVTYTGGGTYPSEPFKFAYNDSIKYKESEGALSYVPKIDESQGTRVLLLLTPLLEGEGVGKALTVTNMDDRVVISETPTTSTTLGPSLITKTRASESIVVFIDNQVSGCYNTQTSLMASQIAKFKAPDMLTTYLYQLISPQGTPLNYLRLWPDGLFTSNATASTLLIPVQSTAGSEAGFTLRFLNKLSINDPIPPAPAAFLAAKSLMARVAQNGDKEIALDLAQY